MSSSGIHGAGDGQTVAGAPGSAAHAESTEAAVAPGLGLGAGREFDLIRGFFRADPPRTSESVLVGPGDDCAVVLGPRIALSCDLSIEGVHFRRDWLTDREIGARASAAALSDLAAMAAEPIGVLVALAIPSSSDDHAATELMAGVSAMARSIGATVLGGDVSRTPGPLTLDITAVGRVERAVLRGGASEGDELWVTGLLGAAAGAVQRLRAGAEPDPEMRERFAAPAPRTREARWLAERGIARAMIDLSDGLAGDAGHLAASSGLAVVIHAERVPTHPSLDGWDPADARMLALRGGEDYELALASAPGAAEPFRTAFEAEFGIPLTRVGRFEAGAGVWLEEDGDRRPAPGGYQHFEERT
jgi:thiamine-monophosphate kinase